MVTLTVTEKGYAGDVPALLARGLRARERADAGPIALVSCDNVPSNGRHLRGVIERAVTSDWIRANVSYPSTMVDRIVPAPTPSVLADAEAALGVRDLAALSAEPYRQWVIEDVFPGGRPAWERAGAVLTADVGPWERLKLRTLNGVHSALAYLGALAGRETIAEALEIPGMRDALRRLVAEDIAPSFAPPPGISVVAYGDSVLDRFANPVIAHRTVQVAMDGSQKLPQRVLHTMLDRRAAGAAPHWAALVVAAWMRFAQGVADDGRALPLDDPLASDIRAALAVGCRRAARPAGGVPTRVRRGRRAAQAGLRLVHRAREARRRPDPGGCRTVTPPRVGLIGANGHGRWHRRLLAPRHASGCCAGSASRIRRRSTPIRHCRTTCPSSTTIARCCGPRGPMSS